MLVVENLFVNVRWDGEMRAGALALSLVAAAALAAAVIGNRGGAAGVKATVARVEAAGAKIGEELSRALVRELYAQGFDPAFSSTAEVDYALGIPSPTWA